jgi:hypothetical protein
MGDEAVGATPITIGSVRREKNWFLMGVALT